ncbi:response regulator [Halomicroarcula sp. GCM10025709]|uniref:response regulator n=1 Tax=Haloarcula TaxID=2237 RepID=UPI0024C31A0A|nr:response regulator [Halomicroarcula sp. YJ-61-S]
MSAVGGGPIRLLCVDDERDFAELTAQRLETVDDRYRTAIVESADAAEEQLAAEPVDCVVSDYDMPDRTGLDLLEAVRAEHGDLPFILFTAKGSEEIASAAISAGVTDYVQKRVSGDQYTLLANRINQAVEQYRTNRELEWYRTVVEAVDDLVYAVDPEGTVLFAANTVELTGYRPERLVGRHISLVMGEQSRQKARERIDRLRDDPDHESATFERTLEDADGNEIRCADHMALLPADDDGFRGTAGIVRRFDDAQHDPESLARLRDLLAEHQSSGDDALVEQARELAADLTADSDRTAGGIE